MDATREDLGTGVLVTPSIRGFAKNLLLRLSFTLPFFPFSVVFGPDRDASIIGILAVVPAAVTVIFIGALIFRQTSRVSVADGALTLTRWGRMSQPISNSSLSTAILSTKARPIWGAGLERLVLLDADGRAVLRLQGMFWRVADLRTIAESSGASVEEFAFPAQRSEFQERYPQAQWWVEAHPVATIVLIVSISLAAIVVVVTTDIASIVSGGF
jgi:hypothetical protein